MHQRFTQLSLAVLLAGGVPLLAQTPSQPPSQPTQPPTTQRPTTQQPTSSMGTETTLTGCVRTQRADAGAADTKGNVYTLEVTPGAGAAGSTSPSSATGSTPPSSASGATAAKTTYTITAPESVGIGKHVGHQVELTGRLQPAMGSGSSGAATGGGAATSSKPEPGGAQRSFQATALKMISAKCP